MQLLMKKSTVFIDEWCKQNITNGVFESGNIIAITVKDSVFVDPRTHMTFVSCRRGT